MTIPHLKTGVDPMPKRLCKNNLDMELVQRMYITNFFFVVKIVICVAGRGLVDPVCSHV